MAKSMRSKREKRLRAIRRDLIQPIYDKKDAAKQAVLEAALAAPKLAVKPYPGATSTSMETEADNSGTGLMEVEMADANQNSKLKPMGKKMKKKIKIAKRKHHGKGKIRKKPNV